MMVLFGQQLVEDEPERMVAGFAATALITVSLFQFGVGIATGRMTPWESYLRTLPASATTRIGGPSRLGSRLRGRDGGRW